MGYDPQLRDYLVSGFREGFFINYVGTGPPPCKRNHPSFDKNLTIGRQKINNEVTAGRLLGPFTQAPFQNFSTSPLGLVP